MSEQAWYAKGFIWISWKRKDRTRSQAHLVSDLGATRALCRRLLPLTTTVEIAEENDKRCPQCLRGSTDPLWFHGK